MTMHEDDFTAAGLPPTPPPKEARDPRAPDAPPANPGAGPPNPEDRRLWERFRAGLTNPAAGSDPAGGFDANDLAAYLEGRAAEPLAERIEAALAGRPDLLADLEDLRHLAGEPVLLPPPAVAARAAALVAQPAGRRTRAGRWSVGLGWAAAAAVVLLASYGGYAFGEGSFRFQQAAGAAETPLRGLELGDPAGDVGLDVLNRAPALAPVREPVAGLAERLTGEATGGPPDAAAPWRADPPGLPSIGAANAGGVP